MPNSLTSVDSCMIVYSDTGFLNALGFSASSFWEFIQLNQGLQTEAAVFRDFSTPRHLGPPAWRKGEDHPKMSRIRGSYVAHGDPFFVPVVPGVVGPRTQMACL